MDISFFAAMLDVGWRGEFISASPVELWAPWEQGLCLTCCSYYSIVGAYEMNKYDFESSLSLKIYFLLSSTVDALAIEIITKKSYMLLYSC